MTTNDASNSSPDKEAPGASAGDSASRLSFQELLDRARAGDRSAWQALFERLASSEAEGRDLHAMARRLLPGDDRARDFVDSLDLLQSALRSGWLDASQFEGESENEFFGWMRTILRRKLSKAVRRKRPVLGLEERDADHATPQRADDAPFEALVRDELQNRLRAAIARLPKEQRAVLVLRLQGLKSPEIARTLGLKPEAVRMRESRAVRKLREMLG